MDDTKKQALSKTLQSYDLLIMGHDGKTLAKLPKPKLLQEIMTFDPTKIDTLNIRILNQYVLACGQGIVWFQIEYNIQKVKTVDATNAYEMALRKAIFLLKTDITAVKEKEGAVFSTNPEVCELKKQMEIEEAKLIILEKFSDRMIDLANAIKKIHDSKQKEESGISRE